MRRFIAFGLSLAGAFCLTTVPAGAEMSRYAGTAYYTSETHLDGTGSYRGVSETVNNVYGPATCQTSGSYRPAAAEEGNCDASSVGSVFFDVRTECHVESLDYPVSVTTADAVVCSPASCYEFDATHNIYLARVGCTYSSSHTATLSGEDIEGTLHGSDETIFEAVSYDADRMVIVARTRNVLEGTVDADFISGQSPADGVAIEVPRSGSTVQGVGLIRGWSCLGGELEAEFSAADGTVITSIPLSHGSSRADTEDVCGDSLNGFSAAMNWNLLRPAGEKTIRLIQNGEAVASQTFSLVAFEEEFVTGASWMTTINDFPGAGRSVTVEWDESQQGFVITEIR